MQLWFRRLLRPRAGRSLPWQALAALLAAAPAAADVPAELLLAPVGAQSGNRLGWSVGASADLNGDGWADFVGGAPTAGLLASLRGRVSVFLGGPGADELPDVVMPGEADGDRLGSSLAYAGDLNGDGFADLVVGAPYNDAGGTRPTTWAACTSSSGEPPRIRCPISC